MFTCASCLSGSHRKCSGRNQCACSVCAARPRPVIQVTKKEKAVPKPRAARGATKSPAKRSLDYSENPRSAYMRDYRQRKAAGEPVGERANKITPEILDEAVDLRSDGMSLRAVAAVFGVDHSYLARRLRALPTSDATEIVTDPFED